MQTIHKLLFFVRNVFRRQRAESELTEELRGYERLLTEQHVRDGMSPEAARKAALAEIGGVEYVKENVRATRSGAWVDGLMQDIRYGFRSLLRVPAFTITAVVALAIGIGASTAIFSVVNGVLLRPLPYRNPDALVTVLNSGIHPVSAANFIDWRAQAKSFSGMAVAEYWTPNVAGSGNPERVLALRLSAGMLPMLGVPPILGRFFGQETENSGMGGVVVLGHNIWKQRFAGDSGVIGKTMLLDGNKHVIVAVMPPQFAFAPFWARDAQLWAPLALQDKNMSRNSNSLRAFARLKPGVSLQAARQEIAGITARLEAQFPQTNADVVVTPLMQQATAGLEKPLIVLLIAVSFLLVAACANVAHMMLARSSSRQREMAVRIAIGASGGKLARQLLCESLMLSTAGGALGAMIAMAGTRVLIVLGRDTIPRSETVSFDTRVLLLTITVSVITGVLFGLAPARNAARTELVSSLKDGGRTESAGAAHATFRHVLVSSQFAIAMTLLIGAGLMMRTLAAMNAIDPGFDAQGVMSAEVSVSGAASASPGNRAIFYQQLNERLRSIPGVQSVGAVNHLPLGGDLWSVPIIAEGESQDPNAKRQTAVYRVSMPGYFSTMRIPFERGNDFRPADRMESMPVAIVNRQFAEKYWPGESAIGKRFFLSGNPNAPPRWRTIIGVVKNTVRSDWTESPEPEMYLPMLQEESYLGGTGSQVSYMTYVARSAGDAATLASSMRQAVAELDPSVSVSALQTMDAVVEGESASQRFYMVLLSAFAIAAMVLAAVGIYGVMSHAVARRMHEMGVRIALGASKGEVMSLVVGRGMRVVLAGAALGIAGAYGLTRLMSTIIYGVRATDPATFAGVTIFLLGVALLACWIPARRATRVDPLTALRGD